MLRRVAENLSAEKCLECQAITAPLRMVVPCRAGCHQRVTSLSACSARQHLHAAIAGLAACMGSAAGDAAQAQGHGGFLVEHLGQQA